MCSPGRAESEKESERITRRRRRRFEEVFGIDEDGIDEDGVEGVADDMQKRDKPTSATSEKHPRGCWSSRKKARKSQKKMMWSNGGVLMNDRMEEEEQVRQSSQVNESEEEGKAKMATSCMSIMSTGNMSGLGLRILTKMGWVKGRGLGKGAQGLLYPLKASGNINRFGLGWGVTQQGKQGKQQQQLRDEKDVIKKGTQAKTRDPSVWASVRVPDPKSKVDDRKSRVGDRKSRVGDRKSPAQAVSQLKDPGRKLLEKMGWVPGSGLGARGQGKVAPIEAVGTAGKRGLGAGPLRYDDQGVRGGWRKGGDPGSDIEYKVKEGKGGKEGKGSKGSKGGKGSKVGQKGTGGRGGSMRFHHGSALIKGMPARPLQREPLPPSRFKAMGVTTFAGPQT